MNRLAAHTKKPTFPARRPKPAGVFLVFLCYALSGCGQSDRLNAPPPGSNATDVAKRRHDLEASIDATNAVLLENAERAGALRFGQLSTLSRLSTEDQDCFIKLLTNRLALEKQTLQKKTAELERFLEREFLPAWKKLDEERRRSAQEKDRLAREERKAQQTALALGTEHRWFWLSSLIAVAGLLALFAHDRRHAIRRYFHGGRAKELGLGKLLLGSFVLLCVVTALLFLSSEGILVDLLDRSPSASAVAEFSRRLQADIEEAAKLGPQQEQQAKDVEQLRKTLESQFSAVLTHPQASVLFKTWWEFWEAATTHEKLRRSLSQDIAEFTQAVEAIESDSSAIDAVVDSTNRWRARANRIAGLIGLAVLSLVAAGAATFARGIQNRTKKRRTTCPLCLSEGQLKHADSKEGSTEGRNATSSSMVRCGHVIPENPFQECGFDFPAMFQDAPKLCFPTLGVPSAGKSHWLAMVYRELNTGNFPPEVEFARIQSAGSDLLDTILRDILSARLNPEATQHAEIPKPVVFNFRDHDGLGKSSIFVSLFDYSGEVFRFMSLETHQRRRALNADGYFVFLDPTKTIDEQANELNKFREDVRVVKKLKAGQQIHCPVALCVPKIDLLSSQGGNVTERYYQDLGEIGWGMDLTSIQKRSNLMQSLRDTIWPGWEIERQVDDLFGGRYMFFPLTPVGLNEPGVIDLKERNIAPVGILHPLMWLLHMSGYPVLSHHQTK